MLMSLARALLGLLLLAAGLLCFWLKLWMVGIGLVTAALVMLLPLLLGRQAGSTDDAEFAYDFVQNPVSALKGYAIDQSIDRAAQLWEDRTGAADAPPSAPAFDPDRALQNYLNRKAREEAAAPPEPGAAAAPPQRAFGRKGL